MKRILHGLALAAVIALALALPYRLFIGPLPVKKLIGGSDAVSSASVIIDKPSGEYVALINTERHRDTADDWISFFNGESIIIMDDIICATAEGDAGGIAFAESLRSRLPENQMRIKSENALMLVSKADHSAFDVIIMSREFAEAYRSEPRAENIEVVEVGKGS